MNDNVKFEIYMILVLNHGVRRTITATRQGNIALGGASTGFDTFVTDVGDTNTTYYIIVHEADGTLEIGIGTVADASPDTLARTTVIDTSAGNTTKIDFAAGSKTVFCTLPASKAVFEDADNDVTLPANLDVGGNLTVTGNAVISGNLTFGDADTDSINLAAEIDSNIIPNTDNTYDLGSPDARFANIYTGDLHLQNDRGHWQIIEEAEALTVINRLTNKRYKIVLEPYEEE